MLLVLLCSSFRRLVETLLAMKDGAYAKLLPPSLLVSLLTCQPELLPSSGVSLLPMLPLLEPASLALLSAALDPRQPNALPRHCHTKGAHSMVTPPPVVPHNLA